MHGTIPCLYPQQQYILDHENSMLSSHGGIELSERPAYSKSSELDKDRNELTTTTTDPAELTIEHNSYPNSETVALSVLQGAALLTADVLGTGLLALPEDVKVLGKAVGLGFLVLTLPVNYYAGYILSQAADLVEQREQQQECEEHTSSCLSSKADNAITDGTKSRDGIIRADSGGGGGGGRKRHSKQYSSVDTTPNNCDHDEEEERDDISVKAQLPALHHPDDSDELHATTTDFISMAQKLFEYHPRAKFMVMAVFYTNIFLVLGNYILVMAHAVAAMFGEDEICLSVAGLVATTLMFAFSQLRTMAKLGRSATVVSLASLAIVVVQCLVAAAEAANVTTTISSQQPAEEDSTSLLRKFSSLASIGFAVGSSKLLLNVRHEMHNRHQAPTTLVIALSSIGFVYVAIALLAGPNPPSFLFDGIPAGGLNRRVAGFFLWIHVAVSYAINSQAICSSIDRIFLRRVALLELRHRPTRRWILLTLFMAASSYLVANAVPFFKDLVALIGALTTIPLTILLPAILHRRVCAIPIWLPTRNSLASYSLLVFGLGFLILGLVGSVGSIELDWSSHGPPFACAAA